MFVSGLLRPCKSPKGRDEFLVGSPEEEEEEDEEEAKKEKQPAGSNKPFLLYFLFQQTSFKATGRSQRPKSPGISTEDLENITVAGTSAGGHLAALAMAKGGFSVKVRAAARRVLCSCRA